MNTQENMSVSEKSLKLAELMGWTTQDSSLGYHYITSKAFNACVLAPYTEGEENIGRCQFAAILLKFPEVMNNSNLVWWDSYNDCQNEDYVEPTQANILDEILRMNGVEL